MKEKARSYYKKKRKFVKNPETGTETFQKRRKRRKEHTEEGVTETKFLMDTRHLLTLKFKKYKGNKK